MRTLKKYFAQAIGFIWNFFKTYWPFFIIATFFLIKTNLFNNWAGLGFDYIKIRSLSGLGFILIFGCWPFLLKKKNGFWYYFSVSVITSLLFVIHLTYNQYAGGYLSISALKYGSQIGSVWSTVMLLILNNWWKIIIFFSDVILLILVKIFIAKDIKSKPVGFWSRIVVFVLALSVGLGSYLYFYVVREKSFSSLLVPINSVRIIQQIGIINYSLQDSIKFFIVNRKPTEEDINLVKAWSLKRQANVFSNQAKQYEGIAKGKNVIYIQLESFQDFVLDTKINGQELTPNFNKFAKENYRNSNFYYQMSAGTTADAEFSSFSSMFPLSDQAVYFDYPKGNYPSVFNTLKSNGYETSIMHGDVSHFWNRNIFYKNYQLDNYRDINSFKINKPVGWGLSDSDFFLQATDYLKNQKKPFVTALITITSHIPYQIPDDEKMIKINENEYDGIIKDYFYSVNYVDKAFGELIEKLKKENLYDESIIVVYGDHTAGLGNYANANFLQAIGANDKSELLASIYSERVPFILHAPNNKITGLSDSPASQIDITPTILNLLGIEKPKQMLGNDIFNDTNPVVPIRRNTALEGSFIDQTYLFLNSGVQTVESGTCYNWREKKRVQLELCHDNYNISHELLRVNDTLIRGNQFDLLIKP